MDSILKIKQLLKLQVLQKINEIQGWPQVTCLGYTTHLHHLTEIQKMKLMFKVTHILWFQLQSNLAVSWQCNYIVISNKCLKRPAQAWNTHLKMFAKCWGHVRIFVTQEKSTTTLKYHTYSVQIGLSRMSILHTWQVLEDEA